MATNDVEKKKSRHIGTYREGPASIYLYEEDGKERWRLFRDTEKGPIQVGAGERRELKDLSKVIGGVDRLPTLAQEISSRVSLLETIKDSVSKLITFGKAAFAREEKGRREPEIKPTDVFYAAVRLTELTQTGGAGGVVASFTDRSVAERFCDRNPDVALFPQPFASRPGKGTRIEISNGEVAALNARGQGKDFNHQFERLQWKDGQGKYFQVGYWNDTIERPQPGQLIHYTEGRDHKDRPVDRLVSPLGRFSPGQPEHPQLIVYELSSRNGLGQVAAIPADLQAAEFIARERNQIRESQEPAARQKEWQQLGTGMSLRGIAEFEKRQLEPRLAEQAKPLDSDSAQHKIRSIVKGNFIADVTERVGEDGSLNRSVLLTHRYMDRDGVERSAGVTFALDELLGHGLENSLVKEQLKGLQQATSKGSPEVVLPPPSNQRTHDGDNESPGKPSYKLELPSLNPDPPANGIQGNRHWVAGVWYGAEPPKKGQFAFFTQGKSHVSERMITPGAMDAKIAEPGDRPQYVLGEIVAKNVIRIFGAGKDLDHAVREEAAKEQKALGLEQNKQQTAPTRSEPRISMADIDSILAMPSELVEPAPVIPPHQNGRPHGNGIGI